MCDLLMGTRLTLSVASNCWLSFKDQESIWRSFAINHLMNYILKSVTERRTAPWNLRNIINILIGLIICKISSLAISTNFESFNWFYYVMILWAWVSKPSAEVTKFLYFRFWLILVQLPNTLNESYEWLYVSAFELCRKVKVPLDALTIPEL